METERLAMRSIPTVNIVAVLHLAFVSALVGVIATETVLELLPLRKKDLHHSAIRFHVWIDLLLELPIALGVIVTGIAMAILVNDLTVYHLIKIACASTAFILGLTCIWRVIRRNRFREDKKAEDILEKETQKIHLTASVIYILLIAVVILGVWLAYNRVLESIYG
jgi:predicted nucleic acid-binding Zn ribbon protein